MTGVKVEKVDEKGVVADGRRIASATVLWTAGVAASPIVKLLGRETDRAGRVSVGPFLDVPGVPDVFVVGDASSVVSDGRPVPGVAQAAIQQGRYVGRLIARQLKGRKPGRPFRYLDKGSMAVVGKNFAILESGRLRISGFVTWLVWVLLHLMSLPQAAEPVAGADAVVLVVFHRPARRAIDPRASRSSLRTTRSRRPRRMSRRDANQEQAMASTSFLVSKQRSRLADFVTLTKPG